MSLDLEIFINQLPQQSFGKPPQDGASQFKMLPFSHWPAPRVFTTFVQDALKAQSVKILPYLDDQFVSASTESQAVSDILAFLDHVSVLELTLSPLCQFRSFSSSLGSHSAMVSLTSIRPPRHSWPPSRHQAEWPPDVPHYPTLTWQDGRSFYGS